MEKYICIHGHFYQPPRENPWIEAVEIQDGAFPYHDWNERITAECYAPNATSRILDNKGRIVDIVSNYSRISFDMGPTLLSWLENNSSETYEAVLEADRLSRVEHNGHGAAMAQCYNHVIMPLADSRDKRTQIIWGIRDFRHRFRRAPEGMWLPETAVDMETLSMLAEFGVKFTVLAPHQARRFRNMQGGDWKDVSGAKIDPKRPYLCRLPNGKSIAIFFYDGPISRAVAFEGLLKSGRDFSNRLMGGFSSASSATEPVELMHIATDGESYGHHHKFGDMALAFALEYLKNNDLAKTTNYGEYLEKFPPKFEVEIQENTSWSCSHGVERWRADCGCNSGGMPGSNQKWRSTLRSALDRLRDELAKAYEQHASALFKDAWAARDDYIEVVLDRSEESVRRFMDLHAKSQLDDKSVIKAIKLLETERNAMLMFTSCGWFFDDIAGIETIQIMQYAGRAMQLCSEALGITLEDDFAARLAEAKSNTKENGTGRDIYARHVKTAVVDLEKVAAHYAITSHFNDYGNECNIHCYKITSDGQRRQEAGGAELISGRCNVASLITGESETLCYCALHLGNHDFNCGVKKHENDSRCRDMNVEMSTTFEKGSFADLVRSIDRHFGARQYGLKDLFKDEQRSVLNTLLTETLDRFEEEYRRMYVENRILMGFLRDTGIPTPKAFLTAAEFVLNLDLRRQLSMSPDTVMVREILSELKRWKLSSDNVEMEYVLRKSLEREMARLLTNPSDMKALSAVQSMLDMSYELPFKPNTWMLQNIYYRLAKTDFAKTNDGKWAELFRSVGAKLNFNLEALLLAQRHLP